MVSISNYMSDYMYINKDSKISLFNYILKTPAISPAVELDKIKEQLREAFGVDDFDDQLLSLIKTATEYGEKVTGRDFINKTYRAFIDCFPSDCTGIEVKKSKLQSIVSIQYYKDGVLTTVPSTDYYVTESNDYSTIYLYEDKSWPTDEDNRNQAVVVEFIAGYGDDSCDIPPTLCQALVSHIIAMFKNAGDCIEGSEAKAQYMKFYHSFIIGDLLIK